MRHLSLSLLTLSFLLTACHQAKPASSDTPTEAPTPKTFALDLEGQLDRIDAEGGRSQEALVESMSKTVDVLNASGNEITYALLEKNANKYAGTPYFLFGRLLQIFESEGRSYGRISLRGHSDQVMWFEGRVSTEALKKREVLILGYLAGYKRYESQAGWNISLPAIAASGIITEKESKPYSDLYRKRYGDKGLKHTKAWQ